MPDVELKVNGEVYGGWTTVSVKRSLKAVAAGFRLRVTDHRSQGEAGIFVKAGDLCALTVHGETVITGYVDEFENSISGDSHSIEVAGRDKTGDLVDCSAVYKNHELLNVDLLEIAKLLVEPFDISVTAEADVGEKFANFSIKPGETVFECLERAARLRGVLFTTTGEGDLVITKLAATRATAGVVLGVNATSVSLKVSNKERFSEYLVKGQITATDENYAAAAAHAEGTAADGAVKRYRPMIIVSENQANAADVKKRAEWEAAFRAANASTVTVTVQGFRQTEDGPLWKINEIVPLEATAFGLKQDLLAGEVEFTIDERGSLSTLVLQRQDAFLPEPTVKTKGDPAEGYY